MHYYQDKWEALSEKARDVLQKAFGIVMGVAAIVLIVLPGSGGGGSLFNMGSLAALAVVLIVPRLLENAVGNPLPKLRKAMLVSLAAALIAFAVIAFVFQPPWLPSVIS